MTTKTQNQERKKTETGDDHIKWRYQDKEYNESFKEWRKQKQHSLGFYFAENPNQLTYQDKVGFIHNYPEAREANAFRRVMTVLGLILLYRVIYDAFTIYFLPVILEIMGLDIHTAFFSGERHGDEIQLITFDLITQTIGRMLPIAILIKHLQMPVSVMLPMNITNNHMFRFGVPAILLVTGVCSVMSFFFEELMALINIVSPRELLMPSEPENIAYYMIQVLTVSIVSEFCLHGVILQLIRQFGDGTALIATSLIAAFVTYDVTIMPFTFISSLVIGYFTIRTGSVMTAVVMTSVQRLAIYPLQFLEIMVDDLYSHIIISAYLFIIIIAGLSGTIHFFCNHSGRFSIVLKERYMSAPSKILTAASNVPLIIWFTISFVVTILHLNFSL